MKHFKDANGKDWIIDIHALSIERVRHEVDVDLIAWATETGDEVRRQSTDPVTIVRVICSLLASQMERDGVNEEDLARALLGDGLDNAVEALVEDLIDFFPKSKAAILRTIHQKSRRSSDQLLEKAMKEVGDGGVLSRMLEQPLNQFDALCSSAAELLDSENQEPEPGDSSK